MIPADKPFPTFFLAGAPRCGTTSMSRALGANPQICFSKPKETHYFSKIALESPGCVQTDYVDTFFFGRKPTHRAMGEGSVSYLYSEAATGQILRLNPEARFLVMVRNPLEMVPSFHRLMLFLLEEDVEDFAEAWALQEQRLFGKRLPRKNTDRLVLQYREIGSLGKYVDRLQQQSSKEQVRVLVYDDFRQNPIAVYRQALEFLGVEYDGRTEMPVRMPTRYYRYRFLHELLYKPPVRFGGLEAMVKFRAREAKRGRKSRLRRFHKSLVRWNTVHRPPQPVDPGMRRVLCEAFAGDVAHLGQLIGRDLGHWLK